MSNCCAYLPWPQRSSHTCGTHKQPVCQSKWVMWSPSWLKHREGSPRGRRLGKDTQRSGKGRLNRKKSSNTPTESMNRGSPSSSSEGYSITVLIHLQLSVEAQMLLTGFGAGCLIFPGCHDLISDPTGHNQDAPHIKEKHHVKLNNITEDSTGEGSRCPLKE